MIGTCGEPKMAHLQGSEKFNGKILHSSQLDGVDVAGKSVAIIGMFPVMKLITNTETNFNAS